MRGVIVMKYFDFFSKLLPVFAPAIIFIIPFMIVLFVYEHFLSQFNINSITKVIIGIIIFIVLFVILLFLSLHIPRGRKRKFNVCLIFVTNNINDDSRIVKQILVSDFYAAAQKNGDIYVTMPNLLSRYFFNYMWFNYPFLNKLELFLLSLLVKLSRSDLILFGKIEPIVQEGKAHNSIKINTYFKHNSSKIDKYLVSINKCINKTAFCYESDNEYDGLKKVVDFLDICSKLYLTLYYSEHDRIIDALHILTDICAIIQDSNFSIENKSVFQKSVRSITNHFFVELSYSNISAINIFLELCEKFLDIYPNEMDVFLAYQYYSMLKMRHPGESFSDYKKSIESMLEACNKISHIDKNNPALLANTAYLNLLNHNYKTSLSLFDKLFSFHDQCSLHVMCEIFSYYRDVDENSFEYEYAKFAYAYYNLKKNTSPEAKNIAKREFSYLVKYGTDEFIVNQSNIYLKNI